MPVLMTLAVMAWLDGRSDGYNLPFFSPPLLRESLAEGLAESDEAVRAEALEIANTFDTKLTDYQAAVERMLDHVIEESADPQTTSADVAPIIESVDAERRQLMLGMIAWRRRLVELLDEDEWNRVFN